MELAVVILAGALVVQQVLHAKERGVLLDRIQAPETVISRRAPEPSSEPLYVPLDDDEAHNEYAESRR